MLGSAEHSAQEVFSAALAQVAGEDAAQFAEHFKKSGSKAAAGLFLMKICYRDKTIAAALS
jgi:hypothetical protein